MEEEVALKLREAFDPHFERKSGNVFLMVGSSECGKSTMLANVLLPILSFENGFITTFMTKSFDSIPIQRMIIKDITKDKEKRDKLLTQIDEFMKTGEGGMHFKITDLHKSKNWVFSRRGYDPDFCKNIYGLKLALNKHYQESDKVLQFKYGIVLDDANDISGRLIREICQTWRNKGITYVQCVQDFTNLDLAIRNSAPLFLFGYLNFPSRRELAVRDYLEPYLLGANIREKMESYRKYTLNKCFLFVNHRKRECYHVNTTTGDFVKLEEVIPFQQPQQPGQTPEELVGPPKEEGDKINKEPSQRVNIKGLADKDCE